MSRTFNAWPKIMRTSTAAAYCDMGLRTFKARVSQGRFPQPLFKTGNQNYFHRDEIDKYFSRYFDDDMPEVF
ncbi:helix-turn-helix transcriptional regulator [Curvivirga aplysinae]|uniref:helix-turn-helix transcriptional regulator n=1 Tax=Curvivirga aplysinae TaxID=2529852 RepID=UPI0012BCBCA5|nr:hypothetical protein [Curvivirga aplysinae]MTI11175.1 DNA-binding protein [Curvivirga aplysinae]